MLLKVLVIICSLCLAYAQNFSCPEECGCALTHGYWKAWCDFDVAPKFPGCGNECCKQNQPWPQINSLATPTESLSVCEIIKEYTPDACDCTQEALWALYDSDGAGSPTWEKLYRQFLSAVLSIHKEEGSCPEPIAVQLDAAAALLAGGCSGGERGTISQGNDQAALDLAGILDLYVNGNLEPCGPEHCGDGDSGSCPEPTCEMCVDSNGDGALEIFGHGGEMHDHLLGGLATPDYCLRLDVGSTGITYSCDADGALVFWHIFPSGHLSVWGRVYGGQNPGGNGGYGANPAPRFINISAEYDGFECCKDTSGGAGDPKRTNDLCVSAPSGTLIVTEDNGDSHEYFDIDGNGGPGVSTVIGDYHRGAGDQFTLYGWVWDGTYKSGTTKPVQDWFGLLDCQPQECPPGPQETPENNCGCGYTIGYYASSRFIASNEECTALNAPIRDSGRNGVSPNSVHDTCRWPSANGDDSRLYDFGIECQHAVVFCDPHAGCLPEELATWWTIINYNYNALGSGNGRNRIDPTFSKKWYDLAKQFVALQLNFQHGFCGETCTHSDSDVPTQCAALFDIVSNYGGLFENGECIVDQDYLCDINTYPSCAEICSHPWLVGEPCSLAKIFDLANNGVLGPDHCEDSDPGSRGCCSGRNGFPDSECTSDPAHWEDGVSTNCNNVSFSAQAGGVVEPQGGSHSRGPAWWDISNFVLNILILLIIIVIIIWGCTRKGGTMMPTSANLEDALKNR